MVRTSAALLVAGIAVLACRADRGDETRTSESQVPAADETAGGPERAPAGIGETDTAGLAGAEGTRGSAGTRSSANAGPAATGPDLTAIHYRALGNEPFWGVDVTADSLVLERPSEAPRRFDVTELRRRPGTDVVAGADAAGGIEITIRREACSDGMSDRAYAFSARMSLDGREFTGCAFEEVILAREAEVDPVDEAGLGPAVTAARAIRDRQTGFHRLVGALPREGADAAYAAHFEGDELRMVEYRLRVAGEVREEASFYYFGPPPPGGTVLLADGEAWAEGSGEHTWYLFGYGADGRSTGRRVERGEGVDVEPPSGMVEAKRALARELKEAAELRRARG